MYTHLSLSLSSRAQGEVSIREALRELEMWGAGCSFSLSPYTDSAGKEMSVIRDWKELVNQVRCIVTIVTINDSTNHVVFQLFVHMAQWYMFYVNTNEYRIAPNFRGAQFSRIV